MVGDGVTHGSGSGDHRWLVAGLIAAGVTAIALAFSDVAVELLLVGGFVAVIVVVTRGLRSRATRWQVVPLGCATVALPLALARSTDLRSFSRS